MKKMVFAALVALMAAPFVVSCAQKKAPAAPAASAAASVVAAPAASAPAAK